jgi:hypothetical protein
MITFDDWCRDVRSKYEQQFGIKPAAAPNLVNLSSIIQERMMRCGLEARAFQLDDDRDTIAILAHHTLLYDDIKTRKGVNDPSRLYGVG